MPLSQQGELGAVATLACKQDIDVSMPLSQQGELGV